MKNVEKYVPWPQMLIDGGWRGVRLECREYWRVYRRKHGSMFQSVEHLPDCSGWKLECVRWGGNWALLGEFRGSLCACLSKADVWEC